MSGKLRQTFSVLLPADKQESSYESDAVRRAIRNYHELPSHWDIRIDLARVYKWLSAEYKVIFDLYSQGIPLLGIGTYWREYNKLSPADPDVVTNYGFRIVNKLVGQVQFLLSCRLVEIDAEQLENSGRVVNV